MLRGAVAGFGGEVALVEALPQQGFDNGLAEAKFVKSRREVLEKELAMAEWVVRFGWVHRQECLCYWLRVRMCLWRTHGVRRLVYG
jgi:hypothetical protein